MTSRNNQERTGAPFPDSEVTPQIIQEQSQSGLSFVIPTEMVDIPSKGKFYPEGHPLHNKEFIEIRHMTAKQEDILTSESLLKKGIAIDRLLESLVVDKSIDLNQLLVGDRNALIVGARITGYGSLYETAITCPACTFTTNCSFDLESLEFKESSLDDGVIRAENATYEVVLPKTGVSVGFRLLTGTNEKDLYRSMEKKKKLKLPESIATDQLKTMISSVNGDTNRVVVNNFIESMPLVDTRYFRSVYEKVTPNLDMNHHFECEHCLHEGEIAVPLTADFFWPNR